MYIITSVTIVANWSGSLIVLSKRSTWVKTLETKRWSLPNELWLDWGAQKILYLLISFLINVLFYSRHLNHNVVLSQHSLSRFYRLTEWMNMCEHLLHLAWHTLPKFKVQIVLLNMSKPMVAVYKAFFFFLWRVWCREKQFLKCSDAYFGARWRELTELMNWLSSCLLDDVSSIQSSSCLLYTSPSPRDA